VCVCVCVCVCACLCRSRCVCLRVQVIHEMHSRERKNTNTQHCNQPTNQQPTPPYLLLLHLNQEEQRETAEEHAQQWVAHLAFVLLHDADGVEVTVEHRTIEVLFAHLTIDLHGELAQHASQRLLLGVHAAGAEHACLLVSVAHARPHV
jgi:hypothetical protein